MGRKWVEKGGGRKIMSIFSIHMHARRVDEWVDTSKTNTQKLISCSIGLEIFDMDWEYNKNAYLLMPELQIIYNNDL